MNKPQPGDKIKMIEHFVVIKDKDNGDQIAITLGYIEGAENVPLKAEKAAETHKDNVLVLSGNSLECEYQGETGRTYMAEWAPIKYGWRKLEEGELTPSTINLDDYLKMY